MRIFVDKEKCFGCGVCVSVCSEVFEIGDDGKCKVKKNKIFSCVSHAIDACPGKAIKVV
ncbi:MAG: ferredoxin [Candidatus Aenigmatarchaeota archaeon]